MIRWFVRHRGRCAASLVAVSFVGMGEAYAYVRTLTKKTKVEMSWSKACVDMDVLLNSRPTDVSEDLFVTAVSNAAAQWSSSNLPCTEMAISAVPSRAVREFVQDDGKNTIQFRTKFWGSYLPGEETLTHPANALAITLIFANQKTGQITDTDMEINGVNFRWGDLVANPPSSGKSGVHDLQNMLTHELGHVIGLDHSCDGGGQSNPMHHDGRPVARCPGSEDVQETTMAAIVMPGDTLRRTLAVDDQNGVCAIYPAGTGSACSREDGGGCAVAKHLRPRPSDPLFLVTAAGVGLLVAWRKKSRGCR